MMNKQEAIEKIEKEKSNLNAWEDLTRNRALDDALAIVRKLDEPERPPEPKPLKPEKPVVPQFVADYIDSEQNSWSTLSEALDNMDDERRILDWFYVNSETFAKAWLFGYEVEKEKLYTVEIPNPNKIGNEINVLMMNGFRQVVIVKKYGDNWKKENGFRLTESEIKKDFEWAWQFAKEVEK